MTNETELRDRLKRIVDETDDGDSAAQAIIDEFGLTVEVDFDPRTGRIGHDGRYEWTGKQSRVVGKWEIITS